MNTFKKTNLSLMARVYRDSWKKSLVFATLETNKKDTAMHLIQVACAEDNPHVCLMRSGW